ncbi:E3 ubiquitin-protein ligase Iruka [Culicoides brevitarsis]|uniref:E3 ubiquitin-protein ligase Iruka n=1 Tax=Culicoides brevitarsis TaxID=469753 RepID=UPI00307B5440
MEAESIPVENSRYFCHSCNTEIDRVSTDFKCPQCLDGFIEELPSQAAGAANQMDDGASNSLSFLTNYPSRLSNDIISNPILTPLLMTASGARPFDAYGESSSDANGGGARLGRVALRGSRGREFNITNFDTILQDILISVSGGEGAPMFFMGNPGDYAWGREGLDTIVTQLLNQMDNTGPPPLEKEKIEELPTVPIEQEQVDMKLQCSVCWEDFQLNEQVRKLPCTHVFHSDCICPWLANHGTCPICRKSLVAETSATSEQQRSTLSAAAQAVANTIRNAAIRPRGSTDSSNTTASTSQSSSSSSSSGNASNQTPQSSQSNRMRDEDGDVDFDFD